MSASDILIVDDEPDILDLLGYNLEQEGFEVRTATDGMEALEMAKKDVPDLVILDIMMPGMDGIEACKRFRQHARLRLTPIIMLTAKTDEEDEIQGLEAGADDYIPKPVSPNLLISRVEAMLRRADRTEEPSDVLEIHDLTIDRDRYLVRLDEEEIQMPRKEFELLYFLASHPGKVFSRQNLLDRVWGTDVYVVDRTVDVHVNKIRDKIGKKYIETVPGVGYRFME